MLLPPLRPFQAQAVQNLTHPGHLICISATGSGKSRIFQELLLRGIARRMLLVSPLIALGRQHLSRLESLGLQDRAWIVSPERLESAGFEGRIADFDPDLLVVDECHSIEDWGGEESRPECSFRPSFHRIPTLLKRDSFLRSLWLSATLTHVSELALRAKIGRIAGTAARIETQGEFRLPETLTVRQVAAPWPDRLQILGECLAMAEGPGIVFAPTRTMAEKLWRYLNGTGHSALLYHAGLSREERLAIEQRLAEGERVSVVATSAFGMGMDFAQLSWAILWQSPPSRLALAQSLGRVARAGRRGVAWLLWDPDDFRTLAHWAEPASAFRQELQLTRLLLEEPGRLEDRLALAFKRA